MKAMRDRRYGKFFIGRQMLENNPDEVRRMMRDILVVRAENSWCRDGIEYDGVSHLFEPVDEGCLMPEYQLYVTYKEYPDGTRLAKMEVKK